MAGGGEIAPTMGCFLKGLQVQLAVRKWKLRVQQCGLHCADDELLTNVRYADDLMSVARSDTDLASIIANLVEELAAVGLHLNTSKTTFDNTRLERTNVP